MLANPRRRHHRRRHHRRHRNPSFGGIMSSVMTPLKQHAAGMAAAAALDLLFVNEALDGIDMFKSSPMAKAGAKIVGYPILLGLVGGFLPGKIGSVVKDAGLFGMAFGVKSLLANFLKPGSPAALSGLAEVGYLGPGSMGYLGPSKVGYLGPTSVNGISGIGSAVGAMADAVSGY